MDDDELPECVSEKTEGVCEDEESWAEIDMDGARVELEERLEVPDAPLRETVDDDLTSALSLVPKPLVMQRPPLPSLNARRAAIKSLQRPSRILALVPLRNCNVSDHEVITCLNGEVEKSK